MMGLFDVIVFPQRCLVWLLARIALNDRVEVGVVVEEDDGTLCWCGLVGVIANAVVGVGHECA